MNLSNLHKLLLDNLKTGVVLLNSELRFLYVNAAAEALLEISDRKAHDLFIGDLFVSAEEDIGEMQTAIIKNNSVTKRRAELKTIHAKTIFVDYTINPFDEDGQTKALLELNSNEQSKRINREQSLSSAYSTTRELVRGLAHEIKNPLTPIQLSAERVRRKYLNTMPKEDAEILDRSTHIIVEQVAALKEMVNAFSDYARSPDMEIVTINIAILLREIIDLYQEQESKINITFDIDSDGLKFDADPGRIRQIIHNLVRNSIEAIPEDIAGTISVNVKQCDINNIKMIEICIEDNGSGFDKNSLGQIFDPYVTSKSKGTGLGLAIVKKLVEEHMGFIEAENAKKQGAVIKIFMPENEKMREKMISSFKHKNQNFAALNVNYSINGTPYLTISRF